MTDPITPISDLDIISETLFLQLEEVLREKPISDEQSKATQDMLITSLLELNLP